jgi:hypothetical protein
LTHGIARFFEKRQISAIFKSVGVRIAGKPRVFAAQRFGT